MDIQRIVKEEIFPMLGEGKIDEAEKKLRRLMLTLTDKNCTEDHRIVLCNIGRMRCLSGDIENAKYYMGRFKEILEKDSISKIDNVILSSVVFNSSLTKVTNKNERYLNITNDIIKNVGGKENIKGVAHCATRLRIVLDDDSKINMKDEKYKDN